ncbi:hypothetical protein C9374_010500 [Naegleria lovaniensis]|uniref:Phospholipase A2 n=1 Tax=Naegleria lovaniensis TaxID=51637 RepID=A0AA88GDY5_NAELO|nr:uncharacterized protein C9374_010500 [Naegleria lovaniensis]KAG2374756.1 hypothetical protein C9374_010500 [Naegleria lovaniensis]
MFANLSLLQPYRRRIVVIQPRYHETLLLLVAILACILFLSFPTQAQECNYTCPRGHTKTLRKGYSPKPNGCGTQGEFNAISDEHGFTHCCNEHDTCYTYCHKSKEECDDEFYQCMNHHCDTNKKKNSKAHSECKNTSSMFFMGVGIFGCEAYMLSQKEACECRNGANPTHHHSKDEF